MPSKLSLAFVGIIAALIECKVIVSLKRSILTPRMVLKILFQLLHAVTNFLSIDVKGTFISISVMV